MYLWTDESRIVLSGLLRQGLSAAEIGRQLGTSRNSVIGKVGRDKELKLIGFARNPSGTLHPRNSYQRKVRPPKPFIAQPMPEYTGTGPHVAGKPLMALGAYECRWSVTDTEQGEQHLFCGCKTEIGTHYCDYHGRLSKDTSTRRKPIDELMRVS